MNARFRECLRAGVAPELLHWAACPQGKGGGSPPPPPPAPDPSQQITAQAKALPSVYSPYGSQVYSGDPNVAGSFTRTDTFSPSQQSQFDAKNRIAQSLLGRTETAIPRLPVGYSFRGAEDPTTNAFFMNQKKMLDKTFDRDEERLEQRLSNQGLPTGSEAYADEFSDFRQSRADAYERAAANALGAGFQQDITTRQQNLNEIAQALGGAQLQPIGGAGSPIDTTSAFANQQAALNRQYQGQLAGYNANVGAQNSFTSGLFGLGAAALPLAFSDRRLKRDIVRVGELMPGIGWYAYNYAWDESGTPKRYGVMADEIEVFMPEAVYYTEDGYAMVDYGQLLRGRRLH